MDSFDSFSVLLAGWFEAHGVPDHLQGRLFEKIRDDVFDAGTCFSLASLVDEDSEEDGAAAPGDVYVLVSTSNLQAKGDIWLVDHCCTFHLRELRANLERDGALRDRLRRILSLKPIYATAKEDAQAIFDHIWKKVASYRIPSPHDPEDDSRHESTWFIHDEVGSAITAVFDRPGNMKLEPLPVCFPEKGGALSVMWCVEDMEEGTIATRTATTVLETVGGREVVALLYGVEGDEAYTDAKRVCVGAWQRLARRLREGEYSSSPSTLPAPTPSLTSTLATPKFPLRVFTDSKLVSAYLTDAHHFILVDLPHEAHVIWVSHVPIEDHREFRHAQFVSQFPEERLFTTKWGLQQLIQDRFGYVDWYQVSYDATSQLREFIGDFLVRKARSEGTVDADAVVSHEHICDLRNEDGTNLWIVKPVNMARSIDMVVSSNLDTLLKAMETGPKVVCKYIADTATLRKRKFDLRFVVAVRSFATEERLLDAYVYNTFWTRFALEDYSLDGFDQYEKHWTVMNYTNPERLLQMHDRDFIEQLNAEYAAKGYGPSIWETVYPKILAMLRNALGAVKPGSRNQDRCRAIYGVDVMLRHAVCPESAACTLEPSLLEFTYAPDCYRACKFQPAFFNDVFATLFLGTPSNMTSL